ncbi:MAG: 3-oxoacyl-[acyl-carrier protein] reductase [Minisyncoccia bacterium]|jgi:3-oxoacyl-[acyl-carrier protein] reductase
MTNELNGKVAVISGGSRLGQPEDVAALVAFLCSPMARHIQGVAIAVDGGGTKGLF